MRVIAGRYRGRRLTAPKGRRTRPTSEKVREAIYAMLGDVTGMRVLDLFAGSGALGIEALSRGAREVVFVERDHAAIAALQENLTALSVAGEQAQIRRAEAIAALQTARKRKETYDLVLVDPPYGHAAELWPRMAALLAQLLAPGAHVVLERDRRTPLPAGLGLALEKERRYGDTVIAIHRQE